MRLVREYALIVHLLDRSMCAAIGHALRLADGQGAGHRGVARGQPHLRRAPARDHGGRGRRRRRPSSRSSSSTRASPTTTWTSTTRWSTSTTATSSWPTAARSWTSSPGATRMVTGDVPPHRGRHLRRARPRPSTPRRGCATSTGRPGCRRDRVAPLPVGGRHRRRHRDAARGRHHRHDPGDHGGHLPLPADARRHAAHPRRGRRRPERPEPDRATAWPRRWQAPPAGDSDRAPGRGGASDWWRRPPTRSREHGYGAITVRSIASRAGVARPPPTPTSAPRTTCWPRSCGGGSRPCPTRRWSTPGCPSGRERVADASSQEMSACSWPTTRRWPPPAPPPCWRPGPTSSASASQFGAEIHRRLPAALGGGADAAVLRGLELAYSGAMLWAGLGHIEFADCRSDWPRRPPC